MNRYVIQDNKGFFLGEKAWNPEASLETYQRSKDINNAFIFGALCTAERAFKEIDRDFKKFLKEKKLSVSFKPIYFSGLSANDDETEMFIDTDPPFIGNKYWQRIALKELTPSEALHKLADFTPTPEKYREHLELYFWDTWMYHNNWPCGGIYDGQFSSLYGYDHGSKKFITENYGGAYYHLDHAASWRILDSGYLMPVTLNGKSFWANQEMLYEYIKYEGGKLEDIKPAFKTSIDLDNFMSELEKKLKE